MPHYRMVQILNLEKPRSALALINLKSVWIRLIGFGAKCRNKLFDFKGWVGNLRERVSLLFERGYPLSSFQEREGWDDAVISFLHRPLGYGLWP